MQSRIRTSRRLACIRCKARPPARLRAHTSPHAAYERAKEETFSLDCKTASLRRSAAVRLEFRFQARMVPFRPASSLPAW